MGDFVTAARAQTMLRDLDRLRTAVRGDNWPDAQDALDKCERWFDQISPNTADTIAALRAENERLRDSLERIRNMKAHHLGETPNEYHMREIARAALPEEE